MRLRIPSLAAALLWQSSMHIAPEPRYFRFERAVQSSGSPGTRACAALDAATYAHAAPDLTDMRLLSNGAEVPYALTMSDTATLSDASARVLNPGMRDGRLVFDLDMPPLAYSSVILQLDGTDFDARAKVTGLKSIGDKAGVALGTFNLYDLAAQHLGRSTTLDLPESTFPFLHLEIAGQHAMRYGPASTSTARAPLFTPASIRGALVPPSRVAQTVYTTLAETSTITQKGNATEAVFQVPARVPVERVSFTLRPNAPNFNRDVTVLGKLPGDVQSIGDGGGQESLAGTIARVHLPARSGAQSGLAAPLLPIAEQQLSVPAVLGINSRRGMEVDIDVHNGDDRPLPIASVRLEMRQRKVCFDAQPAPVTMMYGDSALQAPVYDYARTFNVGDRASAGTLGPERLNPGFKPRPQPRAGLAERHPEWIWVALLLAVGALGVVAFRSARTTGTTPR